MCLFRLRLFISGGYMPMSGIMRSYSSPTFIVLRNLHAVFHSGCTNLHSHQQCRRVPFSLTSFLAFITCRIFDDGHLTRVRSYLTVGLICISPIISSVEHLFMCLLAICMSFLEKCLFRYSVLFFLFF